jgi:hypothetical protein
MRTSNKSSRRDKSIITGDFNVQLRKDRTGYEKVMQNSEEGNRNKERSMY